MFLEFYQDILGFPRQLTVRKAKSCSITLANELLDKKHPGTYNQALMDFGAVICKPQLPLCNTCVLNDRCVAFLRSTVQQLPVKEKSIKKKARWFYYLLLNYNGELYVKKTRCRRYLGKFV
jgi:A/G-specific adenine glycosylase